MFEATTVEPFGPNHSFMRSGSVKQRHSFSRGTSSTRVMTKSFLMSATIFPLRPRVAAPCSAVRPLLSRHDHPVHTEFVGEHAELWREKGFGQRQRDLAALAQRVEHALDLGFAVGADRQRKAFELRLAAVATV